MISKGLGIFILQPIPIPTPYSVTIRLYIYHTNLVKSNKTSLTFVITLISFKKLLETYSTDSIILL
jgi:hypothetical protein